MTYYEDCPACKAEQELANLPPRVPTPPPVIPKLPWQQINGIWQGQGEVWLWELLPYMAGEHWPERHKEQVRDSWILRLSNGRWLRYAGVYKTLAGAQGHAERYDADPRCVFKRPPSRDDDE